MPRKFDQLSFSVLPVKDRDGETSSHVVSSNSTLSKKTEEIVRSHVEVQHRQNPIRLACFCHLNNI